MYNFVDINEVSENQLLPSEALQINGEYIENLIDGYKTLQVMGREGMSAEITAHETGIADGSKISGKRYPSRYITVKYQLIAENNEAFRTAYNQLASILNVEDAELIFNDEPDKFFVGTPEEMGEVQGGTNSIVSEFTIFCADPFKYSVVEYEAEPDLSENSILIDYNGTYKAYPVLEAEFYNENEGDADLTGNGDCGFVAFFNENEKIIQLGDPDETDTETYAKSQTLVNQKFNTETAWNTIAETNWSANSGLLPTRFLPYGLTQEGNVAIAVGHYSTTTAPSTSGTLLTKTSKTAKPYIDYKVSAKTSGRKEDRVTVAVTITAALAGTKSGSTNTTAGAKVSLNKTKLYESSTTSKNSGTRTGTYYLWSSEIKSGRIRITNSKNNVGKSGQVTGWVNVADINLSGTATLASTYGLKGAIQFSGGDWNYATIKSEGVAWNGNSNHTVTLNVTVKNLEADTTILEDIKFKVERTDDDEDETNQNIGVLDEVVCNDLEISTYTAPVPASWYLMPETYGTDTEWHGPAITRTIPADAAGDTGAKNFTFSYSQKMAIGGSSSATQELGAFMALLTSGSGDNRKIVAGVFICKNKTGKTATVRFYVNGKQVLQMNDVDLSLHNKYWGNNSSTVTSVKTSTIKKVGKKIEFNIGGIKKTFNDSNVTNEAVTEITFYWGQYGTKPVLTYNGLYWAKFVKNNCDTWEDIPNKFSSNDVVTADCKSGEIFLNDTPAASLGAMGNDWEDFYLTQGLNQIGFAYSDFVDAEYAPKFKIRYREVFI